MNPDNATFDDAYTQIASKARNIDDLLTSFLGFLHRKTDYFVEIPDGYNAKMGFRKGVAEDMLLKTFKKFAMKTPNPNDLVKMDKQVKASNAANSNDTSPKEVKSANTNKAVAEPRLTENGKLFPIGNGGSADKYYWTQTLKDLTVYVDVPLQTKSKDIKCTIQPSKLTLEIKANPPSNLTTTVPPTFIPFIQGDLEEVVRVEDSLWTLSSCSSTCTVIITLDKVKHTWWKHVIVGHPEIDTSKVCVCSGIVMMYVNDMHCYLTRRWIPHKTYPTMTRRPSPRSGN